MPYYTFVPETEATTLTPADAENGINYLVSYTTSALTDISYQEFGVVPRAGAVVSVQGFDGGADLANRTNYSSVKVGFLRYASGRCAPVFCMLKPTEISTSNFKPIMIYTRYTTSSQSFSYSGYFSSWNASGVFDSKTGYELYYYRLGNYLVSTSRPGAGIEMIELQPATQAEAVAWWVNQCNDGNWVNVRDPYAPAGISETGGGDGNFDDTTDIIPIPPLPTESVSDTGFVNIFNPTLTQLKALATYMWTNPAFDLTNWRAIIANPLDSIISLSIVPVAVPDGGTKTITVGNVTTNVSMTQAATNYIELNCGTITIEKYWGCYLDYSPYTKISLYLPYIGYNTLNIDEVMGNSLQVVYHIDIFTGGCVAFVVCGGSVLYSFPGNVAYNVPVTGADYSRVISGIVGAVSQGVTAIASGGLTAPLAVGTVASMATTVISSKPSITKGGGISGNVGILGVQKPYVEIIRPRQALPQNQNILQGYPSLIYSRLGDLSGYTEIESINLENINATDEEKTEIFNLLNSGVIL